MVNLRRNKIIKSTLILKLNGKIDTLFEDWEDRINNYYSLITSYELPVTKKEISFLLKSRKMEKFEGQNSREDVFSKVVKAGKRTYFFDVKSTRGEELYLTITESKKRFDQHTGHVSFEKHKLFLYREDFEKFQEAFDEAVAKIVELQPDAPERRFPSEDSKEE